MRKKCIHVGSCSGLDLRTDGILVATFIIALNVTIIIVGFSFSHRNHPYYSLALIEMIAESLFIYGVVKVILPNMHCEWTNIRMHIFSPTQQNKHILLLPSIISMFIILILLFISPIALGIFYTSVDMKGTVLISMVAYFVFGEIITELLTNTQLIFLHFSFIAISTYFWLVKLTLFKLIKENRIIPEHHIGGINVRNAPDTFCHDSVWFSQSVLILLLIR